MNMKIKIRIFEKKNNPKYRLDICRLDDILIETNYNMK